MPPTPAPTPLKILKGTRKDRINQNEPVPAAVPPEPPTWLHLEGRQVWARLAPDLIRKGVLTFWDSESFSIFCDAVVRHSDAALDVNERGLLIQGERGKVKNPSVQMVRDYAHIVQSYGARFGLSPSDRGRIHTEKPELVDDLS